MNELEKRSFYSFLALYIVSSFLFLALIGYWYFTAQKHTLVDKSYYQLQHMTDVISGEIIMAQMKGKNLNAIPIHKDVDIVWIDTEDTVVKGKLLSEEVPKKVGFTRQHGYEMFVSDAPREHLNIKYVVAQSSRLNHTLQALQKKVFIVMSIIALLVAIIAWLLSKIFMKPIRQKVEQIERFINDVTHELNTPITSLSMASNQALKQEKCTPKTLKNISISTKQLYDIYRSLTYLNFSNTKEVSEVLALDKVLEKSVAYYTPLAEMKHIHFDTIFESTTFLMPESQATLLFGNLIANAIKYSSPKSTITIVLQDKVLRIKDEGIGIEKEKQKEIFEKFKRATSYAGGFGVGLSIVKSICDSYGINVALDSILSKGTEFRLTFYYADTSPKELDLL